MLNCLDMDHLWDRKRDRGTHIGTNEEAMVRFFTVKQNTDLVHSHMKSISNFLKHHWRADELDIVLVCVRGKHRSVLMAWLVHQVGNRNIWCHGLPDLNDRSWLARPII